MGTDIHSIAQVKRDGRWQTVAVGIDGDRRSYNTFAMLADVRNGYGFAGCRTSTGFPVIHEQRGLPEDLKTNEDNKTGQTPAALQQFEASPYRTAHGAGV